MPEWTEPVAANVVGRPGLVVLRRLRRRRAGRGGCAPRRRRRRLARIRRDAADVPGARRPERDSRRPHRGRAPAGLSRRWSPKPASSPTTARRARTATSSGPASARPVSGRTTAPPRSDPPPSQLRWRDACEGGLACAARRRGGRCLGGADGGGPNTAPDRVGRARAPRPGSPAVDGDADGQRGPRGHRQGDGHLGAESDDDRPGVALGPRERYRRRAGRRERRLPRRLSDRQLADAEDDRRADAIRELARRRRQGRSRV